MIPVVNHLQLALIVPCGYCGGTGSIPRPQVGTHLSTGSFAGATYNYEQKPTDPCPQCLWGIQFQRLDLKELPDFILDSFLEKAFTNPQFAEKISKLFIHATETNLSQKEPGT